jgi:hypothetical protein
MVRRTHRGRRDPLFIVPQEQIPGIAACPEFALLPNAALSRLAGLLGQLGPAGVEGVVFVPRGVQLQKGLLQGNWGHDTYSQDVMRSDPVYGSFLLHFMA